MIAQATRAILLASAMAASEWQDILHWTATVAFTSWRSAIYRRTVDGLIQLVVADPRLKWPDTMAIGPDEHLYVTTSQHDRRAEFRHGEDLRQKPYGLFKVFIGSGPVRAGER
jgi:sugar lactone lactonase YvrE